MQMTKIATLRAIAKVIEKHGGNYSYATNGFYLSSLKKYYNVKIGMRCLIYHMTTLRKEGYIKSIRRYIHNDDGTINRRSSAVALTVKGYLRLARLGWSWACKMANKLGKKYIPKWKASTPLNITKMEELTDEQLQGINENDKRLLIDLPPPKPEEERAFDKSIKAAKEAGVSLYDYLLKTPQPQSPLHNSVKPAAN